MIYINNVNGGRCFYSGNLYKLVLYNRSNKLLFLVQDEFGSVWEFIDLGL